jgi:lipoprotein-anchoring transpeptidase ErfK/SrfK
MDCGYVAEAPRVPPSTMNRVVLIAVGVTIGLTVLAVTPVLIIDHANQGTVADGVRIGALDAGGLRRGEARALVQRKLAPTVAARVTATYRGRRFVLHPAGVQARLDADATVAAALRRSHPGNAFSRVLGGVEGHGTVAPRVTFSRARLAAFAARVAKRIDRPARDADIAWHNGRLHRTHARNGVVVRRPQLEAALAARLAGSAARRSVAVPVRVVARPDRTLTDLARRYPTVIAVDRSGKVLRLYKDLRLEHRYRIAVGRQGLETAAGRYKIQEKVVNPPWHVPTSSWAGALAGRTIPPGDPQNPLEARWMGFHDGQGIHGTADVASLGTAASHGCIRMAVPDVEQLFGDVKVGTPVFLQ